MKSVEPLYAEILENIYTAAQIDELHCSMITLLEMVTANEIELILEQPKKGLKQKVLYLEKIIDGLESLELKTELTKLLEEGDLDFFSKTSFSEFLKHLQAKVEKITIVKLTTAISFKEPDLKSMVRLFSNQIGQPAAFEIKIDHSLIGGAIIQYGIYIHDYSLKSRLDRFRSQWKKATLVK